MSTRLGVGIAASLLALSVVAAPAFAATTQTTLQKEVTAGWKSIATNIKKDQQSVKGLVNRVQKLHNSSATKVANTDLQKINVLIDLIRREHKTVLIDLQAKHKQMNTVKARKAWGQLKTEYNNEHKQAVSMTKKLTSLINIQAHSATSSSTPPAPPAPSPAQTGQTNTGSNMNTYTPPAPPAPTSTPGA